MKFSRRRPLSRAGRGPARLPRGAPSRRLPPRGGPAVCSLLLAALFLLSGVRPPSCLAAEPGTGASKTVVELQEFRQTRSVPIRSPRGEEGRATLVNLNPRSNAWFLLRLSWGKGPEEVYHLENGDPLAQQLLLDGSHPYGVVIVRKNARQACDLWGPESGHPLREARKSADAYAPLCGGSLYLRNPVKGRRTELERATDFLRDQVPGGEKIVAFVRDTFYKDAFREKARAVEEGKQAGKSETSGKPGPGPALTDSQHAGRAVKPGQLGIALEQPSSQGMELGSWYPAKDNPGVYLSVMAPEAAAPEILRSARGAVSALDSTEGSALAYLIAFDTALFHLKFALGTAHPRVEWSDRALDRLRDPSLPGPDGIGNIAPLVSTGLIPPRDAGKAAAAFTGGFKRAHGAFKYGEMALRNFGSHYGFIEEGVVLSRLQPGLATLYLLQDGVPEMKTWEEKDNRLLPEVRYARQNGVPILTGLDPATRVPVPGPLVSRWGAGNWSGSAEGRLRTLRAGAALQESGGKRYLLYAVFTTATPSAMARVFQAYGCRYAMLLDMNALEHTYLAVYPQRGSGLYVQHLLQGMSEVDRTVEGKYVPRFLGYGDNRDFFYLTRKEGP